MILKYLTKNKNTERAEWNYLDNIAYAQTYLDENDKIVVNFRVVGGEMTAIPIDECAYLLNNNGQTIERL